GQKLKIVIRPTVVAESPTYARAFAPRIIEKTSTTATTGSDSTMPEGLNGEVATTTTTETEVDADTNTAVAPAPAAVKQPTKAPVTATVNKTPSNVLYHVVQPGDTLWSIAQRYKGVTIDQLKASNKTVTSRPIRIGDVLKIFR